MSLEYGVRGGGADAEPDALTTENSGQGLTWILTDQLEQLHNVPSEHVIPTNQDSTMGSNESAPDWMNHLLTTELSGSRVGNL